MPASRDVLHRGLTKDLPLLATTTTSTSPTEVLPRALGPYVLLARVGRGGMGDVYLAKHGLLLGFEKHCVLKMLRDDRADDALALARFADEARVVVQLGHRNICPVFDVGRVGSRLYVALEYVVGRDLRTVALAAPMPTAIALHVVGEVLEALDYAHRFVDVKTGAPLGIVHRDVSPHNVLLGVEGDTKLIDFGIATTKAHTTTDGDGVFGKLSYMAPEHARGEVVDGRADQFAAAIMLTELLLGERFFAGLDQQQVWEVVGGGTHRPARFGSLPPPLRAVLDRALSPEAGDRFATCADFGEALGSWARETGEVAAPRDVRRHLRAVFGDLAAEHRALLRTADVTLDALQASPALVGPAGRGDEAQFESIATTLALPTHTPAFGSIASTMLVDRGPLPAAPPSSSRPRAAPVLVAGLLLGVVATVLALVVPWPKELRPAENTTPTTAVTAAVAAPVAVAPDAGLVAVVVDAGGPVDAGVPDSAPPVARSEPPAASSEPPVDSSEPPAASNEPPVASTRRPAAARPPRPTVPSASPGFDAATRADLASLGRCVDKVKCASGILEWSRSTTLRPNEEQQIKEAASDCAKRCRLK